MNWAAPPLIEVIVTARWYGPRNVARTSRRAAKSTIHGPVPEQAPLQPAKADRPWGTAVKVT